MDVLFFFAHALGAVSTIVFLYSDLQEDDDKLDYYYTIGNVFFVGHLLLLGSFIPASTVFLAIVRNVICKVYESRHLKNLFLMIFILIFLVNVLGEGDVVNSIPSLVSVIMTVAFLFSTGHILTLCSIICSILWFIVGFNILSYPIMILETISVILLLYRALKQVKKKREPDLS